MENTQQPRWQRLSPTTLPPSRRGSNLVFDTKHQQIVCVVAGETWLWNSQTWRQAQTRLAPTPRNTTHLVYDAATESILLFGGIGIDGTPLNDVWLWNGIAWTEQHPSHFPPALGGSAIACHLAKQQVILFGGITGFDGFTGSNRVGTISDSTWLWDGTTWTEQAGSKTPPARIGGQLVYDEAHQQALLFGGNNPTGYLNDMWLWDGARWEQLASSTLPPALARYQMTYHGQLQQVVLLGETLSEGTNQSQRTYQTWLWDGTAWSQYGSSEAFPGSIEGFTYDAASQMIIACIVAGGKTALANKSASTRLPELAAPSLASETWSWG